MATIMETTRTGLTRILARFGRKTVPHPERSNDHDEKRGNRWCDGDVHTRGL